MGKGNQYILGGIIILTICVLMIYLTGTRWRFGAFGWPRYHMNLDQPAFLIKELSSLKYIKYYNKPGWVSGKEFEGCHYSCKLVSNLTFSSAEVVIFHGPNLKVSNPPKKIPGQIWIMHGLESPCYYRSSLSQWNNLFNWTFTYRRDSDILSTYSGFQNTPNEITSNRLSAQWMTKDRATAWIVSHCATQSKRGQYVDFLQNATNIHVYGNCGKYKCSKSKETHCMELLQNHYRFYLAFENSLCVDYVTEKGFKTYFHSPSTIPVMRGGLNYSIFFPPGSYLDTKDFDSVYKLGKAINANMVESSKMKQFFSWTKSYSIDRELLHKNWCSLCEQIHNAETHKRLYANINNWLNDKPRSGCRSPSDLPK